MNIFQNRPRRDPLRLLYEETSAPQGEIYHELSKLNDAKASSFRRRLQSIIGPEFFLKIISQSYKTYPTAKAIPLAKTVEAAQPILAETLRETIVRRRSIREFSGKPLTYAELGILLDNCYGITGKFTMPFGIEQQIRAVPSGGGLFPLEIYVGSFRVDGVAPGIYHYNVRDHALELVRSGMFEQELGQHFYYEEMFKTIGAVFIISGVIKRSSLKYGERAYRFMHLEAGHVGQSLCLSATALGLGCLMLGGFMDDAVNEIIQVDGLDETVLYGGAVGRTS